MLNTLRSQAKSKMQSFLAGPIAAAPQPLVVPDDLSVHANGAVYDPATHDLDYLWFDVGEHLDDGVRRYVKAIRLVMLTYLPSREREQSTVLLEMQKALKAVNTARIDLVCLSVNILDPDIGVVQIYGAQACAASIEEAAQQAAQRSGRRRRNITRSLSTVHLQAAHRRDRRVAAPGLSAHAVRAGGARPTRSARQCARSAIDGCLSHRRAAERGRPAAGRVCVSRHGRGRARIRQRHPVVPRRRRTRRRYLPIARTPRHRDVDLGQQDAIYEEHQCGPRHPDRSSKRHWARRERRAIPPAKARACSAVRARPLGRRTATACRCPMSGDAPPRRANRGPPRTRPATARRRRPAPRIRPVWPMARAIRSGRRI